MLGWNGLGSGLGLSLLLLVSSACSSKVVLESPGQAGSSSSAHAGASGRGNGSSSGAGGRQGSAGSSTDPETAGDGAGPDFGTLSVTDKVDLLFMIDNSLAMADKQALLRDAIPLLVKRLVTPICIDAAGDPTGEASSNGSCTGNGVPEFPAVTDMHLGIVSSSIGAHGGTVCSTPSGASDTLDDRAHLIPTMRTGVASYNNTGFLAWDAAGDRDTPPGDSSPTNLVKQFQDQIMATGEHGCGYEASLESWYRFLVDPEPPDSVTLDSATNSTVRSSRINIDANNRAIIDPATGKPECTGCDKTLLAQRAAFLRPDSLVVIVMLSDENDCSIRDDGVGWFVGSTARMPRATAICETNPNDVCCRSCAQNESAGPPVSCLPLSADESCRNKTAGQAYATWDALHDSLNLRCYKQHQRFGFDLLYPTSRYVDALQQAQLPLQSNPNVKVTNPLYDAPAGQPRRARSLVVLAGIVGVPWQDLADEESIAGPGLNYLSADELTADGRWAALLGDPEADPPVLPNDPFMVETTEERSGKNALAGEKIAPADSTDPLANSINGHEQKIPSLDDLQYACIFPLAEPRECMPGAGCDCAPDKTGNLAAVVAANSPVCQPPEGGPSSSKQYFARAYPGTRELEVLSKLGNMAVVSSICPKVMDTRDADYGYNPAVNALVARLKDPLLLPK